MKYFTLLFLFLAILSCNNDNELEDPELCGCDTIEGKRWYADLEPIEGLRWEDFMLDNGFVTVYYRSLVEGEDVDQETVEEYAKYEISTTDCSINIYDVTESSFMGASPDNDNTIDVHELTCNSWLYMGLLNVNLVDERP